MNNFVNDYSEGAHEKIMYALCRTNMEQTSGYGEDIHTRNAINLIKDRIRSRDCDIHFLMGGTQTNLIFISHVLRQHQAVIAARTGHISTHEAGSIEATGHKIIEIDTLDGKLTPKLIEEAFAEHTDIHMVQPKMVYLSNPTELGTLYCKSEIEDIKKTCMERDLFLYIDGARLASALTSYENDIRFEDYPKLCDAFYIGGTKNGALFGEALVIINDVCKEYIRYSIKQRGGLLAKGRLLGVQFETLFSGELYEEMGRHANKMARRIKRALAEEEIGFLADSNTNQQFPIFPKYLLERLSRKYILSVWKDINEGCCCVRLVTSWATKEADVEEFIEDIKKNR